MQALKTYTELIHRQVSADHILTTLSSPAETKSFPFAPYRIALIESLWEGEPEASNKETAQSPLSNWTYKQWINMFESWNQQKLAEPTNPISLNSDFLWNSVKTIKMNILLSCQIQNFHNFRTARTLSTVSRSVEQFTGNNNFTNLKFSIKPVWLMISNWRRKTRNSLQEIINSEVRTDGDRNKTLVRVNCNESRSYLNVSIVFSLFDLIVHF